MGKTDTIPCNARAIRVGGNMGVAAKIRPVARSVENGETNHPAQLISTRPIYRTQLGAAYGADALAILEALPDGSVNAVITSPPYALHFKKEYGNVDKQSYVQWMVPFAREIKRVLKREGSFVLNIGGSYDAGAPTRSLYHFKLLIALVEEVGFYLAQECFWHNPAKLPSPTEWVNVRRFRIKDSVEYVWWLSPTEWPTPTIAKCLCRTALT
jgi:site-specific DNA-methyltransferase (cytosine-N4-specific)